MNFSVKKSLLALPALMALVNCNQTENGSAAAVSGPGSKPPLVFDESKLVPPDIEAIRARQAKSATEETGIQPLAKSAAGSIGSYTFGIGTGVTSGDLAYEMVDGSEGEGRFLGPYKNPGNDWIEATNSSRFNLTQPNGTWPEALWVPYSPWQNSGVLLDNESSEQHFFINTTTNANAWCRTRLPWQVDLDYKVSSESGWDMMWIKSTGTCGDAGVVRLKISGEQTGHLSFQLPDGCSNAWVGIYYIKDGSLARGSDRASIKNVAIRPMIPTAICPPQ